MFNQLIGERSLYRRFFAVAIPLIVQNGITNFVSLLDNIMVGQVGTLPMSGVSIVNNVMFVFNLCIFGASAGAGIFTAQFHGSRDQTGIRHTFRFKVIICSLLSVLSIGLFLFAGSTLIGLYLTGEGDPADAAATLAYGESYLKVMLWGLIPFALSNAYSSTLRETGKATVPMVAGICAVFVNLCLNYTLIFGHFGAPQMGVRGAALATVISRYVELAIVVVWTHGHRDKCAYIVGAYRSPYIPSRLLRSIFVKGLPLLVNEFFWASGIAIMNQCYSTCGLDVVPAMNINSTIFGLGSVAFLSMGNSVGIIMGQMLGSGSSPEDVRRTNRQLVATSVLTGAVFGSLMAAVSGIFPQLYNTTDQVRSLASSLICVCAVMMPFNSYTNATYFTLRSGGKTMITFLFDSCFVCCFCVPLAYCLSRFTGISILPLYAICQATDLVKCALGAAMLKQGKWIQNLTH